MGYMNACGNERMNVSESSLITQNPLSQQNLLLDQNNQNIDQTDDVFSLLEQQNFNLDNMNSFQNQMEPNSTDFVQTCFACSTILKDNMPCLQLCENYQL